MPLLFLHLCVFSSHCVRAWGLRIPRCTFTNANSMTANSAGVDDNARADFAKGIEIGCKRGCLLASRHEPWRSHSLEFATSDGSGRGCLLITGKHYPSSPSRAFRSRFRPAMQRDSPSHSQRGTMQKFGCDDVIFFPPSSAFAFDMF